MAQARPSAREQERRAKQRQQATGKVVFGETPELELPGIGRHQLRLRNPDLALLERRLTPLLDELPERLSGEWQNSKGKPCGPDAKGARWVPYANIWDALEVLGERYPMDTVSVLLYAALRHVGVTEEQVDDLPPWVYQDPNVERALGQAVAIAFGAAEEEADDDSRPTGAGANPEA